MQVPLHDADTTKADGKNLTPVVDNSVQKKSKNHPVYCLACKAEVLDTLYRPSYMTVLNSTSGDLGLESVIHMWTMVVAKESILDVGAKVELVIPEGVQVLRLD